MLGYIALLVQQILRSMPVNEDAFQKEHCACISLEQAGRIHFAAEQYLSESSVEKRLVSMVQWIQDEMINHGLCTDVPRQHQNKYLAFFDMIEIFSVKVLKPLDSELVVQYEKLQMWHDLTCKVGEDIFVACAYYHYDRMFGLTRNNYLWKQIIHHDDSKLNDILRKGISDNHCHLRGAAPYFELSWAVMMNEINRSDMISRMRELDKNSRNLCNAFVTDMPGIKFEILHLKAVVIRLYLYSVVSGERISLARYKVSLGWVFRQIMKYEKPQSFFENVWSLSPDRKCQAFSQYLEEGIRGAKIDTLQALRERCPGFYWIFWGKYFIPFEKKFENAELFSKSGIDRLAEYMDHIMVSLKECCWILWRYEPELYHEEWMSKTRMELERLLQDDYRIIRERNNLQGAINCVRQRTDFFNLDYAIGLTELAADERSQEKQAMVGERCLLYRLFHDRYQKRRDRSFDEVYNLFFLYLMIKDKFRRELIQENDKMGFDNFRQYQNRKCWFTFNFSEGDIARSAVHTAFDSAHLKSLELRISPGRTCEENLRIIQYYDRLIQRNWDGKKEKFYYVFSFGKRKESLESNVANITSRQETYRHKILRVAHGILMMREKNPFLGLRVRGIDASSSEDGCRPEVFAHVFRLLKGAIPNVNNPFIKKMPQLRATYHVGEDNQDVLDGVRAIDEAITFLNLSSGDRLGHAVMLGMDAMEWYGQRRFKVSIRQQDYLDNISWLYQNLIDHRISNQDNVLEYLENEYSVYFQKIYGHLIENGFLEDGGIHTYYAAWTLRGDDPEYYKTGRYCENESADIFLEAYRRNEKTDDRFRHMNNVVKIYYAYQYDHESREKGNIPVVVDMPLPVVHSISEMQKILRNKVTRKGIAIEINPSSNLMIAGLNNLTEHPVTIFYDKYLKEKNTECSQIPVSINTDDSGVFATSLYNEYSLMAYALGNAVNSQGESLYPRYSVYDWINSVRKMGNHQSFTKVGDYKNTRND